MNYQSVYTITPVATSGTWLLDGQLIPNPFSFGAATYTDGSGTHAIEFINAQLPGATHPERLDTFLSEFQRWRLAYASVTIYQDGPDLANQGTVVVCQKPVEPVRFNMFDGQNGQYVATGLHHAFHLEPADLPDYTRSQSMPNAYFGRSREGVYIPLKLTKTHQHWHSHRDLTYQASSASMVDYTDTSTGGRISLASSVDSVTTGQYPFLSLNDLHQSTGTYTAIRGTLTSDFCNENWADFSFRNMAVTTSLSLFFRFGFEVQVMPQSSLAPHLKLSPESDPLAISTYFGISRELKDAYPAEYNDLGKIWDVISSVAKKASPFLGMIPGIGPAISGGVNIATDIGDRVRGALRRTQNPTQGSTASAADLEIARSAVAAPPRPVVTKAMVQKARKRMAKKKAATARI